LTVFAVFPFVKAHPPFFDLPPGLDVETPFVVPHDASLRLLFTHDITGTQAACSATFPTHYWEGHIEIDCCFPAASSGGVTTGDREMDLPVGIHHHKL